MIMMIVLLVMLAVAGLPIRILSCCSSGIVARRAGGGRGRTPAPLPDRPPDDLLEPELAQHEPLRAVGHLQHASRPRTPSGRAGSSGSGSGTGRRPTSATCPSSRPTSSSPPWASSWASSAPSGVLALLGVIAWRVLHAAGRSRDVFGRLICAGLFTFVAFSVFQNAGMTMGIMPITGIPLPFVSYGGTAVLVFFAAVGLALSVGARRRSDDRRAAEAASRAEPSRRDGRAGPAPPGLPGDGRRGRRRSTCPRSTRRSPWSRPSRPMREPRLPGGAGRGHRPGPGPAPDGLAPAR